MKNNKFIIAAICTFAFLASIFPVEAQAAIFGREGVRTGTAATEIKQGILNRLSGTPAPNLKDRIKALLPLRALMGTAKLTGINGAVLTVEREGKSYTVNTGTFDKCTTQLRRRFWGTTALSEFTVGDVLNIAGYWTDDAKTSINACYIRNISIQKRYGVFIGEIKSLSDSGFVMSTVSDKRSDQTVTISAATKFNNRKGGTIGKEDLQVGQKVRVRGLWDRNANSLTEVTEVKDFSLPPLPTKAVIPTAVAL